MTTMIPSYRPVTRFAASTSRQPAGLNTTFNKAPQFSGRRARVAIPALLASAIAGLVPGVALSQSYDHSRDFPASYSGPTSVEACGKIPGLTQDMNQILVDLKQNPIISPAARQRIEDAMAKFWQSGDGQIKTVILPNIPEGVQIRDCSDEMFNKQLRLGKPGLNDGLLVLINADNFRNNEPQKLAIQPGTNYKPHFTDNPELDARIEADVLPNINAAAEARRNGNLTEAQRHADKAIENAVNIFISEAHDYREDNTFLTDAQKEEKARIDAENRKNLLIGFLKVIGLLIIAGGIGITAYQGKKRFQRLGTAVETVTPALKNIGSQYNVTRGNIYSYQTLNALLSSEMAGQRDPDLLDGQLLLDTIDFVIAGIKDTPDKGEKIREAFRDNALLSPIHPSFQIRHRALQKILADSIDVDDYHNLITLAQEETHPEILKMIIGPICELATQEDLDKFSPLLTLGITPGSRLIAAELMTKFAEPNTVSTFMDALEKEQDPQVITALQDGIYELAKPADSELLKAQLASGVLTVKDAAIGALGHLGPMHFDALYDAFKADDSRQRIAVYLSALSEAVTEEQEPALIQALKANAKEQEMALTLLNKLCSTSAVEPILDYLASEKSTHPQAAVTVLLNSVGQNSRNSLVQVMQNMDSRGSKPSVRIAATMALSRVEHSDNLKAFVAALEKEQDAEVIDALFRAIGENPKNKQSFQYFAGLLAVSESNANVRLAAISALEGFGSSALPVLFDVLGTKPENSDGSAETRALMSAISRLTSEQALEELASRAQSTHTLVNTIATQGVVSIVSGWEQASYDDQQIMSNLDTLARSQNSVIKTKAMHVRDRLIQDKAAELTRIGSQGDVYKDQNKRVLTSFKQSAEPALQHAATAALRSFNSRYEEAERRRRIEEERRRAEERARAAAAAAAAAEAARRSSYSSSSDFGGGGGGSSGGGSDW